MDWYIHIKTAERLEEVALAISNCNARTRGVRGFIFHFT